MEKNYMVVRKSLFYAGIVRFCFAGAVSRESAVLPQKATRYKVIPASGGNPRTAGTVCPQAANSILEHWIPQNATPLSFLRDRFNCNVLC